MTIGAAILCGGKSRRMGQDKAQLTANGRSFLEILIDELSCFPQLLLSASDAYDRRQYSLPVIGDIYPNCGPMGGIYSVLEACRCDAMLCISCDIPLFTAEFGHYLCSFMTDRTDAVLPVTSDGRRHPLCAIYHRRTLPTLLKHIEMGSLRLSGFFNEINTRSIDVPPQYSEILTANINTPQEYEDFRNSKFHSKGVPNNDFSS